MMRFALAVLGLVSTALATADTPRVDPSRYSQAVTDCDRRASHPEDPHKVVPGLTQAQIDLPAAIAACRADLAKDEGNPRLLYQLARVLAYSGAGAEGLPYIERAAALGYPQAQFVAGYLYLDGILQAPKDPCRAGTLIRDSAINGRMAGLVGFPAYVLEGRFKGCGVRQDREEMQGFLAAAKAAKPDYYQSLLIADLARQLAAPAPVR
jgi:TPR repeat protein